MTTFLFWMTRLLWQGFFFVQNNSDFYLCVSLFIFWKIWDTLKKYEVTNKNVQLTLKKITNKKVGVTLKIKCIRKKTEGAVNPLFPHVVFFFSRIQFRCVAFSSPSLTDWLALALTHPPSLPSEYHVSETTHLYVGPLDLGALA